MDVYQAIDNCMESLSSKRSPNTVRIYRNGLSVFVEYITKARRMDPLKTDASALSVDIFMGFVDWIGGREGLSRATAGVYVAGMKRFYRWLLANDIIRPTPNEVARFQDVIEDAQYRKGEQFTRTPGKGHLDKMLAAIEKINEPEPRKSRDKALVLFLASSGLRNNEARALTVKDIDLSERVAYVKNAKGDKQRKAFFGEEAATAIREYWNLRGFSNKSDPLFARHDKGAGKRHEAISTATVRNIVDYVAATAGIEKGHFTPHYFRHAFAIEALRRTGNLAAVQDLLGHASPHSTRIYAKIDDADLQALHREIFK